MGNDNIHIPSSPNRCTKSTPLVRRARGVQRFAGDALGSRWNRSRPRSFTLD